MSHHTGWIPRKDLAEELGCSARNIDELVARKKFVAGQDFYRTGASGRGGSVMFCVDNCRQALLKLTAEAAGAHEQTPVVYDEQHTAELIANAQAGVV